METTHTKEYPKRHWSEDIRLWRKFEFGLGIIAIVALLASLYGNYQAYIGLEQARIGLEEARNEAEESRIVNAWQILSNRSPGNTGKKSALETLNNAKEDLRGIDLSCETMDGVDKKIESCDTPTFLANVSLPNADLKAANLSNANLFKANLSNANLQNANLRNANLYFGDLSNAHLRWINLRDAALYLANLSNANLNWANLRDTHLHWANVSGANLSDANLSNADFNQANVSGANLSDANLSNADFNQANLSNTIFCDSSLGCVKKLTQLQIDKAWAWADSLPVFKAGEKQLDLAPPPLCPVELRPEYEANEETGKPDGC